MAKTHIEIEMTMDADSFREKAKSDPASAGLSLDPELRAFENWMLRRGMDPLSKVERAILREYLGSKLVA
jgi:hypothetical protein